MSLQVDPALAVDLRLLSEVAGRLARHLEDGLADLSGGEPHATVPTQPPARPDVLLSARDVAEVFGIGIRTLRRWRHEGRAPRPLKGKGPLRWRRADIDRWLEEHSR
jgi:predicted DNA-binding transcriptional regulator AlpA